jgi:GH24 family phage-related lysozyme (muramidase)
MSVQRTFRDVAKPKVVSLTASLAGGVLPLGEATMFYFSNNAVLAPVTSISGHQYLVDGQPIYMVNAHPSASLVITIGSFSKTIPAGYGEVIFFDKANTSFKSYEDSALKQVRADIVTNASAISSEVTNRGLDTATLVKLDGTRPMTGNLNLASHLITNVTAGASAGDAINKGQLDSSVAALTAQISANASALSWREPVDVVTKFTVGSIPLNNVALSDSNFGSGSNRLFEDDDAPTLFTTANIAVGSMVLFNKAGVDPKLMVVRDVLGTKKWYDATETDVNLKVARAIAVGDTFIVKNDLLDVGDAAEGSAMYHILAGTPKQAIKIGDLDWDQATGINLSPAYTRGAGGATVVVGDTVEQAFQKLDGNVEKNKTDAATNLSTAIATEVTNRNTAISTAIATEVTNRDGAITTSQNAQNAKLASTAAAEGASLVGIQDSLGIITATTVEGALAENRVKIDQSEADITGLQADVSLNTTNIAQNTSDIAQASADLTQYKADLASTAVNKGASKIGIQDAGGNFIATTVEGALAELDDKVDALNLVNMRRGLFEAAATGATSLSLTTAFKDVVGAGGVVQDLSSANYMNAFVIRDGAVLIGSVGYTIAGATMTFTAAGGGELLAGEIIEIRIVEVA